MCEFRQIPRARPRVLTQALASLPQPSPARVRSSAARQPRQLFPQWPPSTAPFKIAPPLSALISKVLDKVVERGVVTRLVTLEHVFAYERRKLNRALELGLLAIGGQLERVQGGA